MRVGTLFGLPVEESDEVWTDDVRILPFGTLPLKMIVEEGRIVLRPETKHE